MCCQNQDPPKPALSIGISINRVLSVNAAIPLSMQCTTLLTGANLASNAGMNPDVPSWSISLIASPTVTVSAGTAG